MTANDKYSLLNGGNLTQPFPMHLSQKQKTFSKNSCAFFQSKLNFENFQKRMTLIAYVYPILRIPNEVVR